MVDSGEEHHPAPSSKDAPSDEAPTAAAAFPSLSIWPPSQRTRDAVTDRLVETLSAPSVLSKRYGVVPRDEASVAARLIEAEAFAAAGTAVSGDSLDEGLEALQIYSKEISKRMLESAKEKAGVSPVSGVSDGAAGAADVSSFDLVPSESAASTVLGGEEVSSVES